ncbi:MAG: hypothetical protein NVSMB9_11270 [Isosphaeraceae bacterium]
MSQAEGFSSSTGSDTMAWGPSGPLRELTGRTLGDFQVERLLGRGGMGEVYLARQISLNRMVAFKVLRSDLLKRPAYLKRFEAEATAVAKLNHPNIVHIYTLGETDGIRFIAMEYVQGTNLRAYIDRKGAIDYPLSLSIMRQTGLAVGAAGEIGLVHRDIKPENLLMTRKGQVKVADFGLCRDLDAESVSQTQTGITLGTPLYMSPEQAQGHSLDHRSDLYSLGVTFYHMLAGVPPFRAESPLLLAMRHVKDLPASLAVHRPDIPPDLDRLVLKLMAKSPSDRYSTAAEMLRDLATIREAINAPTTVPTLSDITAQFATIPAGTGPPGSAPPLPLPSLSLSALRTRFLSSEPDHSPSARWPKIALVAISLLAGAGLGWMNRTEDLLGPGSSEPTTLPGLWIDPRWREVDRENSAESQYLHAQIRASRDMRKAAWLAVPGHFPASHEWATRSYTQLARLLFRRLDADRLAVLAGELDRWSAAQTHEHTLALALRVGVKELQGDFDGVLDDFDTHLDPSKLTDPSLIEFCLEIIERADHVAARDSSSGNPVLTRQRLHKIRQKFLTRLVQSEMRGP